MLGWTKNVVVQFFSSRFKIVKQNDVDGDGATQFEVNILIIIK